MTKQKTDGTAPGVGGWATGILTPRLEGIPDTMQPYMQLTAKLQSDWMTLWGKRSEAWLDWPNTLMTCRTTADVTQAQSAFLETMQKDYAAYLNSVLRDTMIEPEELVEDPDPAPEAEATVVEADPAQKDAALSPKKAA